MKTYTVTVKQVHDSYVEVEANSPEEAIIKVEQGEGEEVEFSYAFTLDSDGTIPWNVHENPTDMG